MFFGAAGAFVLRVIRSGPGTRTLPEGTADAVGASAVMAGSAEGSCGAGREAADVGGSAGGAGASPVLTASAEAEAEGTAEGTVEAPRSRGMPSRARKTATPAAPTATMPTTRS